MTGSIVVNFHEGSRSEYLAQCLFSAFGTSIPVPHQEDSGVDFYCTMTDRLGQLAWPKAYFTVQVKSSDASWTFNGSESVRWLIEQPLPLYFCVVDKSKLRFRVYHTLARFHIWSLGIQAQPDYLELTPGPTGMGECTHWDGSRQISLSAPILEITLTQLESEKERVAEAREVLKYWLDLDKTNLAHIATGTLNFVMPQHYETNTIEWRSRTATQTFGKRRTSVTEAELHHLFDKLHPSLVWLARVLIETGDPVGAAITGMLMRHWNSEDIAFFDVAMKLNQMAGIPGPPGDRLYALLDDLIAVVQGRLEGTPGSGVEKPMKS